MSDIKFDGEWVTVEGNWLKVRTLDLMLDAQSRRINNTGYRRALVHDSGDKLTVNYAKDYPGGVNILGNVSVEKITQFQLVLNVADVILDYAARRKTTAGVRRAFVHDFDDGLTINWASDYPGGVTINGTVKVPGKLMVAGRDISATLAALQTKITQLEARVAALEAGS
jgi:hypothetical protein